LEAELGKKNSYINNFRKQEVVSAAEQAQKMEEDRARGFDNVNEMDDDEVDRSQYCAKCKYESRWCSHRKPRDDQKQAQQAVLTSAQALGWREPYDNLTFGNARSGILRRTIHDKGHL
jgi:hypothetical protein